MALAAASGSTEGSGNGAPPGAPARHDEPSTAEEKKKQLKPGDAVTMSTNIWVDDCRTREIL